MGDIKSQLMGILYLLPAVVVGFTVHEFAHAFCAVRFGDDTPKIAGRFTLNPLKHVDPIGLAMVLLFGYGWAKPVRYDPAKLRKPIEHSVLISLAGPASNLLLAVLAMIPLKFALPAGIPALTIMLDKMVVLNLMLFIFNLVPLPPLDGSHLVYWAIPERFEGLRRAFLRYGYWALAGILLLQAFLDVDVLPIGRMIESLYRILARLFRIPLA